MRHKFRKGARLVRTCARENIRTIEQAKEVLRGEEKRYNNHQVHSSTAGLPILRFQKALKERKSLFRGFRVPLPYRSTKNIFCLRAERVVTHIDEYPLVILN